MMEETIVNKISIYVSKSIISWYKRYRSKDFGEKVEEVDILKKIKEALSYDEIITNEIIEFKIIHEKFQGIYIEKINHVIYFTPMLSINGINRGRNTFVTQNYKPVKRFATTKNASISISLNPYDIYRESISLNAATISKDLKTLRNLGVKFNKSIGCRINNLEKFRNLNEYLEIKNELKEKNKGNNSAYIKVLESEKSIWVYGKLDGANNSDTLNTCNLISILNDDYNLNFICLNDEDEYKYKKDLETVKNFNFKILNTKVEENQIRNDLLNINNNPDLNESIKRNQKLFIKNIINKYKNEKNFNIHKCFACDYVVETNFIASHIYRFADIINDFKEDKIDIDQALHFIVSGENGFLLCPSQDKEFEKGQIIFDYENKKFIANKLFLKGIAFQQVQNKIINQNFKNISYTQEFFDNIKKHIQRTSNEFETN